MTSRRLPVLAALVALAAVLVPTSPVSSVSSVPQAFAHTVDGGCARQRGPIRVGDLAAAVASGCSVVGRMVTDGRISVMVPPAGLSAVGDGLGRHGDVRGLTVVNTGTTVRVRFGGAGGSGGGTVTPSASRRDPAACSDRTFHLEHHKWTTALSYHLNLTRMPAHDRKATVVAQVQAANANMRKGRNTCGRPAIRTPASHYLGTTRVQPNIKAGGPSCGSFNRTNVVGFGNLPGGLLGWTCYWWDGTGHMVGVDMMIDNGASLVTSLPATCSNDWDFEGTVTHEWGHAYGLAHTGDGHGNLTMQHLLKPCSTYARTLGLGDWLGMNRMYGHR